MDFRNKLFGLILVVILGTSGAILFLNKSSSVNDTTAQSYRQGVNPEIDRMVGQAELLYRQKRAAHEDISAGPCLTNNLSPNWVADLVHNPRTSIDDLPVNQCSAYLDGRATHFVELDLDGNLVRVH